MLQGIKAEEKFRGLVTVLPYTPKTNLARFHFGLQFSLYLARMSIGRDSDDWHRQNIEEAECLSRRGVGHMRGRNCGIPDKRATLLPVRARLYYSEWIGHSADTRRAWKKQPRW